MARRDYHEDKRIFRENDQGRGALQEAGSLQNTRGGIRHRQRNRSDRRFETFTSVMKAVNKRIKGELSDDELDNIAGGMSVGAGIGLTLGVAAAFGAAAA